MNRKTFLTRTAAVLGAGVLPRWAYAGVDGSSNARLSVRFAHLTDIHVKPGKVPEAGMANALQSANSLTPKVDFVVNGGDSIMDALKTSKDNVQSQWEVFARILKSENDLPVYHCLGNHDIWGWGIRTSPPLEDPLFGKAWALEELKMPNRYYAFDKGKWRFFVLDSLQQHPASAFYGRLDDEQVEWLTGELRALSKDRFACVVSHIPIMSLCAGFFDQTPRPNTPFTEPIVLMHADVHELKNLFHNFPQVKVCISGHIHLQDEVEYLGVKYYCNGAVSGNWWKGTFQEFPPAYAVMELYDDGTSNRTMVNYG